MFFILHIFPNYLSTHSFVKSPCIPISWNTMTNKRVCVVLLTVFDNKIKGVFSDSLMLVVFHNIERLQCDNFSFSQSQISYIASILRD